MTEIPFETWIRQHRFTPTELEDFLACPFGFYARSYLKIDEPPRWEPELNPAEIGILLHRILEKSLRNPAENLMRIAADEIEKIQKHRPNLIPALVEIQKGRIERMLTSFLEKESAESRRLVSLRPAYFEWSFGKKGRGGVTQPLQIPNGDDKKIPIAGRIDRIDVDEKRKQFLVIDYKTGSRKVSGNQIQKGESLQLPLYILAVQLLLLPGYEPIGGLYYHLSDLTMETGILHADRIPDSLEISPRSSSIVPAARWDEVFTVIRGKVAEVVDKIRNEEFPSTPDSCDPWCPFRDVCRVRSSPLSH